MSSRDDKDFGIMFMIIFFCWCFIAGTFSLVMLLVHFDSTTELKGYVTKYENCLRENALKEGQKCVFIAVVGEE